MDKFTKRNGIRRNRPGTTQVDLIKEKQPEIKVMAYPLNSSICAVTAFVSQNKLQHNAKVMHTFCPDVQLCAVVKANAYGHGAEIVTTALAKTTVNSFAVSSIDEAKMIAKRAIGKPILVTVPTHIDIERNNIAYAQKNNFHLTVASIAGFDALVKQLHPNYPKLAIHIKLDTGLGRIGISSNQFSMLLAMIQKEKMINLCGVYTHFATTDLDSNFVATQKSIFDQIIADQPHLQNRNIIKHACNTSGIINFSNAHYNMVRSGIGLYGYLSGDYSRKFNLRPVMKLVAPLVQIRQLKAGQTVGYDQTYTAPKDITIGIVPIGYADGISTALSNKGHMAIDGIPVPIIGKVSMDLTVLDISRIKQPHESMPVTVIDDNIDSPCSIGSIAALSNRSPYEVMTALGSRIKRVLIQ
jgi:alanine racemase